MENTNPCALRTEVTNLATEILALTEQGALLTPWDFSFVKNLSGLDGAFDVLPGLKQLKQEITNGSYSTSFEWFHGLKYLAKNGQGYVFWKGVSIEHFSYGENSAGERDAAIRLEARCRKLESLGFPVTSRTVLSPVCLSAPANTPWKLAMQRYYSFFKKNDSWIAIFYKRGGRDLETLVVRKAEESVKADTYETGFAAYHALLDEGAEPQESIENYDVFARCMEALGISPESLDSAMQTA